ncbi:heavy metal-associated isoprenylated plant protein 37 [Sesbania bispinosa]|nr:heavy metal-associated isoprenylated plant protein 37 [Sesbania bispinosa]
MQINNVKKCIGVISAVPNNGKMNSVGNANGGKKGGPNQNMAMKDSTGGLDQKTMAALKLNNAHLGGGESLNLGEAKRASDIGAMINLAGFNGNGANVGSATVLGGNSNGLGGFPVQSNMIPGSFAAIPNGGFATGRCEEK